MPAFARTVHAAIVPVLTLGCLAVWGCSPSAPPARTVSAPASKPAAGHDHDHDHADKKQDDHEHDHPETLAAGVAAVEKMWAGIRTAVKDGKFEAADDLVHEVGHLLEDLPELLAKAKPAGDLAEAGKKAIDDIFSCFESIDTALHAGEEEAKKIDLDGITPRIEAALKSLSGLGS